MAFSLNPLVFIPILSIFLQQHFLLVYGQCLEDQQSSLLQLKQSLVYNPALSSKLFSWDSEADCCSWRGVNCNDGYVTDLDLSNESISGGIDNSSSLFDLHHLQSLSLASNRFHTTQIPFGLGKLINLRYLNLSHADFAGQIPAEISSLTKLISLDLSAFQFVGYPKLKLEDPNLLTLVQNLTSLIELNLSGVNISAQGREWCQALSSSLPNLRELKLASCFLAGPLDSSLSNLNSLSVIHLDRNNLSTQVPEFFVNFTNLKTLSLRYCGLYGAFPEKIFQLPTLQKIDISENDLLQGFLPEFHQNGSLQVMVLSETNFSGLLPNSVGCLKMLSIIELRLCNFRGSIPNSIVNLSRLVYLDFSHNWFNGSIPSFNMSKNVTHIDLSFNDLTGDIASISWENLLHLVYLNMRNSSLNGLIPLSLFSLPSLQRMILSDNQFSGQLNDFSVASSSQLDTLDLSSNKLEGPIPVSIFELCGLRILKLSSNNFNGTIELSVIQKLGNLSHLDLSFNNLSLKADFENPGFFRFPQLGTLKLAHCKLRTFPGFLRNQSRLFYIDLSDNQIIGEIPKWIWKLPIIHLNLSNNFLMKVEPSLNSTLLTVLDLHSNLLEGDLPVFKADGAYMDYSKNEFSSVIPPDIGNFLNLCIFFSLSSNNLQGIIPVSICNAMGLRVLDLSYNALSGRLPQCLLAMTNLGVLNLRRNRFNGTVPDLFSENCGLQTLNLNGNLLQGKLPKSLANCKMLEVMDIGNNQINDSFPSWLSDIRSLRVLVMRSNKFHGPIFCEEKKSSWQMLKIVDLASNYFSGRLPNACLATWEAMVVGESESQSNFKPLQFEFLRLNELSYRDAITVTSKGLEMQLTKILTVFASIDFSCNSFEGPIPEMIGSFRALYVLNLSHNALRGQIPQFVGNLRKLESLDLSSNKFCGEIPLQLANLNFLSFLNLSNNNLVGKIPVGTQLQSFSEASFANNTALCGLPLKEKCGDNGQPWLTLRPVKESHSNSGSHVDWNFISAEMGFIFGFGIIVAPLVFWRRFRIRYYNYIDLVLFRLFPQLHKKDRNHGRKSRGIERTRLHKR